MPDSESKKAKAFKRSKPLDSSVSAFEVREPTRPGDSHGLAPGRLPVRLQGQRPVLLFADDDSQFLRTLTQSHLNWHKDSMEVEVLHIEKLAQVTVLCDEVMELRRKKGRIDAVFLDIHLPTGHSYQEYLAPLRNNVSTKYVPVVLMTASSKLLEEDGEKSDDNSLCDEDATYADSVNRTIFGKNASGHFLFQTGSMVSQLRDSAWDAAWDDLHRSLTNTLRDHPNTAADLVAQHLRDHLDCEYVLIRSFRDDSPMLHLSNPSPDGAPPEIDAASFEPLRAVLESSEPVGIASLNNTQVAPYQSLLAGYRFLGRRIEYRHRPIGTLTLYRAPTQPAFRHKDKTNISYLATKLSIHFGALRDKAEIQRRQSTLIRFATYIASHHSRHEIAQHLADTLHREINGNESMSKTSVRLIEDATGRLTRQGYSGYGPAPPRIITMYDSEFSSLARAVDENEWKVYEPHLRPGDHTSALSYARSEIAGPISTDKYVWGALNLASETERKYDDKEQREFVAGLSNLAALALQRIASREFQIGMLQLLRATPRSPRDGIIEQAMALLARFAGCTRILRLTSPGGSDTRKSVDTPWNLEGIWNHPKSDDVQLDEERYWQSLINEHWNETLIGITLRRNDGHIMEVVSAPGMFVKDRLNSRSQALIPMNIQEDAGVRSSVLVLLFRHNSSVNEFRKRMFTEFGSLLSLLMQREVELHRHIDEKLILKQQAAIGEAYNQFRHTLSNQTGGIGGMLTEIERHIEEAALDSAKLTSICTEIFAIRNVLTKISKGLDTARFLVRVPVPEKVNVSRVWNCQIKELQKPAVAANVHLLPFSEELFVESDSLIIGTILYNLIDNAIEACNAGGRVWLEACRGENSLKLAVCDNGKGVDDPSQLFTMGYTTKSPHGTGFALYYSRARADALSGSLTYERKDGVTRFYLLVADLPT